MVLIMIILVPRILLLSPLFLFKIEIMKLFFLLHLFFVKLALLLSVVVAQNLLIFVTLLFSVEILQLSQVLFPRSSIFHIIGLIMHG